MNQRVDGQPLDTERADYHSGLLHVLMGAAIGLAIAFWVFGADFFSGSEDYWKFVQGDAGSGLAALRYYLEESWGFPLLEARGLNVPDGVNIAFTDSLPILALTAKILSPLGFSVYQWFSLWYLALYMLQGVSAVVAVRAFGVRSLVFESAAAVIAVSAPILMLRTWHPGLAGQFTLLLAWAILGHLRSSPRTQLVLRLGIGLVVLSLLIHVYLVFGTALIVCSAVLGELVRGQLSPKRTAVWFAQLGAAVFGVAILGGYFQAGAASVGGYYLWGVHLLGPVTPQWSKLWPGEEWILQSNGSFEGFNWLGMGWVVLLAVALLTVIVPKPMAGLRRFWGLAVSYQVSLATMVVLGLYSITPNVRVSTDDPHDLRTPLAWLIEDRSHHSLIYGLVLGVPSLTTTIRILRTESGWRRFAGLLLLSVATGIWSLSMIVSMWPIELVTGQFRVAGRLFWPISYGLLTAGCVALYRWGKQVSSEASRRGMIVLLAPVLMVGTAGLQVADVGQFRAHAGSVLASSPERVERLLAIESLISGFELVHIEPGALNCISQAAGPAGVLDFQDLGIVASWATQHTDAIYAARQKAVDCGVEPVFVTGGESVTVVVVLAGSEGDVNAPAGFGCRELSGIVACSQAWG